MDKITKEHLEILANIGKKKDIQAFIVKNYFKMLDLNNIIKEYLHFRGLYEVERKPRIKKIDTDLINRIKENEDMIMRRDELNKREGFERGFKSGYDEGMKEGLKKGLDDGYKNGVSKAMLTFIKNNLRIEDLLKVEEYTELVRN
jgi:flagellar biosynthesis/type III secretory pathway protein FliH